MKNDIFRRGRDAVGAFFRFFRDKMLIFQRKCGMIRVLIFYL